MSTFLKAKESSLILVNTLSKTLDLGAHHGTAGTDSTGNYSNGHATTKDSNLEGINNLIKSQIQTTGTQGAIILGHFNSKSLEPGNVLRVRRFSWLLSATKNKYHNFFMQKIGLSRIDEMKRILPEKSDSAAEIGNDGSTHVWLTKGLYDYATGKNR